jgi:hypothetical protein
VSDFGAAVVVDDLAAAAGGERRPEIGVLASDKCHCGVKVPMQ